MSNPLTQRETQALQLAALGYQLKEAARELGIALDTLKDHHKSLRLRLRARNIAQAVAIGVSSGFIFGVKQ